MTLRMSPRGDEARQRERSDLHQEWLLDEALMETFPASDPSSPYQPPGGAHETATAQAHQLPDRFARRGSETTLWLIVAGCAIFGAAYVVRHVRR